MSANIDAMLKQVKEEYIANKQRGAIFPILERIILAGKLPLPKELKIGGYQTLAVRIEENNKRIGTLEERMETMNLKPRVKEKIEALERRVEQTEMSLSALEQIVERKKKDAPEDEK